MTRSADSQAMLLLRSHLGLPADAEPRPLTARAWNPLASVIQASALKSPGSLLGMRAADIQAALGVSAELAQRLAQLLERGGTLAIELERLDSLGIWTVTCADEDYPGRLRERLKEAAPAVLFASGDKSLIGRRGMAVVGSRSVDEAGQQVAAFVGEACAACGLVVYSGAARGVDLITMRGALSGQGKVVGILADSLEKTIRSADTRDALERGDLALVTPYSPKAGFSVGNAMGRNKLIYALADYALVVASEAQTGGTWAGATEALNKKWLPLFVAQGPDVPEGNKLLLRRGGIPFPVPFAEPPQRLEDWLAQQAASALSMLFWWVVFG